MIDKPSTEGKPPKIKNPEGVSSERINKKDDFEGKKIFSDDKLRIKELEKELSQKESEIMFFKEKMTNNQEIILDVIEEKKQLKKQINDFELKELDLKLNNYMELQRKHHKIEHRLFVTKNHLDEANKELEFRAKIIEDLENRGVSDYILGKFPDSYQEYKKRDR
jgi:chromosome segregation ATPase